MTREQKIKKDAKALQKYRERMERSKKEYMQTFSAYAVNQRRSRAAAIGECALQAMDAVRGLMKTKPLIGGTLDFVIDEKKVQDETGMKGFACAVTFHVFSDEPKFTDDEIKKEIEDTFEKMMRETDDMFPEEKTEDKG